MHFPLTSDCATRAGNKIVLLHMKGMLLQYIIFHMSYVVFQRKY